MDRMETTPQEPLGELAPASDLSAYYEINLLIFDKANHCYTSTPLAFGELDDFIAAHDMVDLVCEVYDHMTKPTPSQKAKLLEAIKEDL